MTGAEPLDRDPAEVVPVAAEGIVDDERTRVIAWSEVTALPARSARRIPSVGARLPESAERVGDAVAWVDIEAGTVQRIDAQGRLDVLAQGMDAPSMVRAIGDDLIVASRPGVQRWEGVQRRHGGRGATVHTSFTPAPEDGQHGPHVRFNDGRLAPDGALWAGTCDEADPEMRGSLWRRGADRWAEVVSGMLCSNGVDWTADGSMLVIDSLRRRMLVGAPDASGCPAAWRVGVRFELGDAIPDGLTVLADGRIAVAVWGGRAAIVLSADGTPVERIDVPCDRVTSSAEAPWGLVLTGAATGEEDGGLFVVDGWTAALS
ncbi:SMP-30/gluconolactonase/LRE family protein [Microbacterium sp.]|uniref:SMP-30/gluconolactonase/LRE family protein n=1 Tax=Microbacterium sp. TaxID=51671 RepID=UPI0039E575FA